MSRALKVIAAVVLVSLALLSPKLYWGWRNYKVWAFCRDVHAGMSLSDLSILEKRHGIDDTYSPHHASSSPSQGMHDLDLTGGGNPRDDYVCWVQLNGTVVTTAVLMEQ